MLARFGSALILIGIVLMVVYLVSASIEQGTLILLLFGAGISALGLYFRKAGAAKERSASRFRTVRKVLGNPPESAEEE